MKGFGRKIPEILTTSPGHHTESKTPQSTPASEFTKESGDIKSGGIATPTLVTLLVLLWLERLKNVECDQQEHPLIALEAWPPDTQETGVIFTTKIFSRFFHACLTSENIFENNGSSDVPGISQTLKLEFQERAFLEVESLRAEQYQKTKRWLKKTQFVPLWQSIDGHLTIGLKVSPEISFDNTQFQSEKTN